MKYHIFLNETGTPADVTINRIVNGQTDSVFKDYIELCPAMLSVAEILEHIPAAKLDEANGAGFTSVTQYPYVLFYNARIPEIFFCEIDKHEQIVGTI